MTDILLINYILALYNFTSSQHIYNKSTVNCFSPNVLFFPFIFSDIKLILFRNKNRPELIYKRKRDDGETKRGSHKNKYSTVQ